MVQAGKYVEMYNNAVIVPSVKVAVKHFAKAAGDFQSELFVSKLSNVKTFPAFTISDIIHAASLAGVAVKGVHASLDEMKSEKPFLTYLFRTDSRQDGIELVRIEDLNPYHAIVAHDRFGTQRIPIGQLQQRWSGINLIVLDRKSESKSGEIEAYRKHVSVIEGFLTQDECNEIIEYSEKEHFRRSRVVEQRDGVPTEVVSVRARSSSSVVLYDRNHPVLSGIYRKCADIEAVPLELIESIQCVRYKRGQMFRSHFDGGVNLARLATFLLYLNDGFVGGETYFPILDQAFVPKAGSCLRFPSCMRDGRIIWQSEHGGLPIKSGVKYAMNIWIRCPSV